MHSVCTAASCLGLASSFSQKLQAVFAVFFSNLGIKVKPAYWLKRKIAEYHFVINLVYRGRLNFNCWLTCNFWKGRILKINFQFNTKDVTLKCLLKKICKRYNTVERGSTRRCCMKSLEQWKTVHSYMQVMEEKIFVSTVLQSTDNMTWSYPSKKAFTATKRKGNIM